MNVTYTLICEGCYESYSLPTTLLEYNSDAPNLCQDCIEIEHETQNEEEDDTANRCIYK